MAARAIPSSTAKEDETSDQDDVVVWTHGKLVRVETPEKLTKEVWTKLNRYIQAIKP